MQAKPLSRPAFMLEPYVVHERKKFVHLHMADGKKRGRIG